MEKWVANLLLLVVLGCWSGTCLPVKVSDVSGFTKLRSWKQSTLYRIESDADYDTNPLLLQLVGSRYGNPAQASPASLYLLLDMSFCRYGLCLWLPAQQRNFRVIFFTSEFYTGEQLA